MNSPVAPATSIPRSPSPNAGLRRITMREVAERAGVNLACVSVVLNGAQSNARVSFEARERILMAAQELGYKKNGSMSSLAKGRFGCVALLLSTNDAYSWLPRQMLDGIYEELAAQNLHLTVFQLPEEDLADQERLPKILREWLTDGILVDYTHNIPAGLMALLGDPTVPAVWINSKQHFDCGHPDDFSAGVKATQDLLALGHRRIAYVDIGRDSDESRDHYSLNDRYQGYEAAMSRNGCAPLHWLERGVPLEARSGVVARRLQNAAERPTALICSNGDIAIATLWAALELGLQVPQNLSILSIGHSTKPLGRHLLTSYVVPEHEMGRRATALLLQKIAAPSQQFKAAVLPFIAVEGNTVGKVPR